MTDTHKMNYLKHITKKCFGEEVRPKTGLCMIIFAVPLLIPGVTMTAVAFEEETSFSKYSAFHIFGMVLVVIAILLLVGGFLLRMRFISQIAPDDGLHETSTHSKMQKDVHLDTNVNVNKRDHPHKDIVPHSVFNSVTPHVNYLIEQDYIITKADHGAGCPTGIGTPSNIYQRDVHGQSSSMQSLVDDSSSCESSDSEDYSSASYTITEDTPDNVVALSPKYECSTASSYPKDSLYSESKTQEQRPDFSFRNFKTTIVQSTGRNTNNFFQHSTENNVCELKEVPNNKVKSFSQSAEILDVNRKSNTSIASPKDDAVFQTDISQVSKQNYQVEKEESCPDTRQRLQGLSSDALSISSDILIISDTGVLPTDTHTKHSAVSSIENSAYSNTSVFSIAPESKTKIKLQNNRTMIASSSDSSKLNQRKTWVQSPYATQAFSIPTRGRLFKSTSSIVTSRSPHLEHSPRPSSSEDYSGSSKTLVSLTPLDPCSTTGGRKREY